MKEKILEKCYELCNECEGVTLELTPIELLIHCGNEKVKHFATPEDFLEDEMNGAAIQYYNQIAFQSAEATDPWGRLVLELSALIHRLPHGVSVLVEDGKERYSAVAGEVECEMTFLGVYDTILDAAFEVCKEEDRRSLEKFLERPVKVGWYEKS